MARIVIPYTPRPPQPEMHAGMESRRWAVIVAHRRMGKTVSVLNHMLKRAIMCDKRAPFYAYVAPFYHQAKAVAWDYLLHFTGPIPGREVNRSELSVKLPNGATIRLFGADNPDSLRGLYFDGVVMDEFADMKSEAWDSVIRPALSDRQGWAVFIGTPRGHNKFYEIYQAALRDSAWFTALYRVDQTGVLPEDEIEALKKQMTDSQFRQEYLCDFDVSSSDILIPLQLIDSAVGRDVIYTHAEKIMGVDVGMSLGGDPSAIVVRQGGNIIHLEEFRMDNTLEIAGRVKDRYGEYKPQAVYGDVIGWGAGVMHTLAGWGLPSVGINVAESASESDKFNRKRDELWWKAREFFAEKQCSIRDTLELRHKFMAELSTPTYGRTTTGKIKVEGKDEMKKREVASPNLAEAFIMTMAHVEPLRSEGFAYSWTADDGPGRVIT